MKKILSIFGTIILIGTSTTSLVACNTPQYTEEQLKELKEKHKIDTKNQEIRDNLEWIAPQEKPFNTVDNKHYYVVWRTNKENKWEIIKFKNDKKVDNFIKITNKNNWNLFLNKENKTKEIILNISEKDKQSIAYSWKKENSNYFKSVYRWNLNTQKPDLIIDDNGNVKVNGE
ncbi:lipoprotein [Spiroplasma endosymbiont of Poecilobothrus nobilitatus]|uniref:lipoprotein n=1 Tax=Spiroplasma endosymbiont of Poecilobothrus nobilitatus TaxID=1209220 RepID=UPI00313D800C